MGQIAATNSDLAYSLICCGRTSASN